MLTAPSVVRWRTPLSAVHEGRACMGGVSMKGCGHRHRHRHSTAVSVLGVQPVNRTFGCLSTSRTAQQCWNKQAETDTTQHSWAAASIQEQNSTLPTTPTTPFVIILTPVDEAPLDLLSHILRQPFHCCVQARLHTRQHAAAARADMTSSSASQVSRAAGAWAADGV